MFMGQPPERMSGRERSDDGDDGRGDRLHPQQPARFVNVGKRKTACADPVDGVPDQRGIARRDAAIRFVQVVLETDADVDSSHVVHSVAIHAATAPTSTSAMAASTASPRRRTISAISSGVATKGGAINT